MSFHRNLKNVVDWGTSVTHVDLQLGLRQSQSFKQAKAEITAARAEISRWPTCSQALAVKDPLAEPEELEF